MTEDDEMTMGPDSPRQAGVEIDRATIEFLLSSGDVHPLIAAALFTAREEARTANDRMLRAVAETENQGKRMRAELEDNVRHANRALLEEMIRILDSLELCVRHAEEGGGVDDLEKGVSATVMQFQRALENVGVEAIPAEAGMPFEPRIHEAVSCDAAADQPINTITTVVQSGYRYKDRLLRPARVVVATGAPR